MGGTVDLSVVESVDSSWSLLDELINLVVDENSKMWFLE